MQSAHRWVGGLMLCLAAAASSGCSAAGEGEDEDTSIGEESAELRTGFGQGEKVVTTARLRFRDGPSTSDGVVSLLAQGTTLTILNDDPENGFYEVALASGARGYCHGGYLRAASGSASTGNSGGGGNIPAPQGDTFRARGTGYYPANNAMEGGFVDRKGARLRTLQQYLAGNAEYVSVAMDTNAFPYGQRLRIRELEQKYGREIQFRVVDTGGAFRGRGRSRIDICTASSSASLDPTINGMLTITVN